MLPRGSYTDAMRCNQTTQSQPLFTAFPRSAKSAAACLHPLSGCGSSTPTKPDFLARSSYPKTAPHGTLLKLRHGHNLASQHHVRSSMRGEKPMPQQHKCGHECRKATFVIAAPAWAGEVAPIRHDQNLADRRTRAHTLCGDVRLNPHQKRRAKLWE